MLSSDQGDCFGVQGADRCLRRQLDTFNLCFNCDDLLSVQSRSPGRALVSALNSDGVRALGGLTPSTDPDLSGSGSSGSVRSKSGWSGPFRTRRLLWDLLPERTKTNLSTGFY